MNYDKPNLRNFKHGVPYVSIWYSLIIHVVLFVAIINLVRVDFGLMANDFKKEMKGMISRMFTEDLSPGKSMINELFKAKGKFNPDKKNLLTERYGS